MLEMSLFDNEGGEFNSMIKKWEIVGH
jgi:hypothetical protein